MGDEARAVMPGAFRIFLVEDNPGDVYLLEKALNARRIRYDLTRLEDGEQAMRTLATVRAPDLILLDLNLPRRGGFDILKLIRGEPSLVGVPVGIFTSSDVASDRHRSSLLGAEQ